MVVGVSKSRSMFRSTGNSGGSIPLADGVHAHAFHTRLVDSWSTKLRTEVGAEDGSDSSGKGSLDVLEAAATS